MHAERVFSERLTLAVAVSAEFAFVRFFFGMNPFVNLSEMKSLSKCFAHTITRLLWL